MDRCTNQIEENNALEDEILAARLREGSREAFDELYHKYKNLAIHTAYLITGNLADGEDVVQETFVKIWLHARELRNDSGLKPWMMQILVRTAYRMSQKSRREIPDENVTDKMPISEEASSLDKVIQSEEAERIMAAVRALPVKLRTVVVLFYYNSFSVKEIARTLQIREGTVKSRLHAARRRMKAALQEDKDG